RAHRSPLDRLQLPWSRGAPTDPHTCVPVRGGNLLSSTPDQREATGTPPRLPVLPRPGHRADLGGSHPACSRETARRLLRGAEARAREAGAAPRGRQHRRPDAQRRHPQTRAAAVAAARCRRGQPDRAALGTGGLVARHQPRVGHPRGQGHRRGAGAGTVARLLDACRPAPCRSCPYPSRHAHPALAAGARTAGLPAALRHVAPAGRPADEPAGVRRRQPASGLQHRRQLRHQHQLAELWRRNDRLDLHPDGRTDGAELRLGRHRRDHRGGAGAGLHRQSRRGRRQLLGRPDAHQPLCPAAHRLHRGRGSGRFGRGAVAGGLGPGDDAGGRIADHQP
ncbi:hypothetical protein LTR94_028019, partial [Friedmanniomyces endolithicus]